MVNWESFYSSFRTRDFVPGYEIAGHNLPCRTVGGDYFDFFPYADGRIGLVLGDVSGKGMPAALLMTALKGGVQVLLGEAPEDVSSLMSRLDRVVAANFPRNRFVSLFFGLLDPATLRDRVTRLTPGAGPTIGTYCGSGITAAHTARAPA